MRRRSLSFGVLLLLLGLFPLTSYAEALESGLREELKRQSRCYYAIGICGGLAVTILLV